MIVWVARQFHGRIFSKVMHLLEKVGQQGNTTLIFLKFFHPAIVLVKKEPMACFILLAPSFMFRLLGLPCVINQAV